jgi:FHA domain
MASAKKAAPVSKRSKAAKPAKAARAAKPSSGKSAKGQAAKAGSRGVSAKGSLLGRIARALGVTEAQAELRALRELAERLGLGEAGRQAPAAPVPPAAQAPAAPAAAGVGALPQRLFLALDGRGLDGLGLPMEVINLPCLLGSAKTCAIWISSPNIETRHAQITQGDSGWVLEDLGSEHGTFFDGERIGRRVLQNGDTFLLAGYLRVRAELR